MHTSRTMLWITLVVLFASGLASAVGYVVWYRPRVPPIPSAFEMQWQLLKASRHLELEQFDEAELLARRMIVGPDCAQACLIAAEAAMERERFVEAMSYLDRAPRATLEQTRQIDELAVRICLRAGRLAEAEQRLRTALQADADHNALRSQLAYLLVTEGRRWEASVVLLDLVRRREFTLEQLIMLGDRQEIADFISELPPGAQADPALLITRARVAAFNLKFDEAREYARQAVAATPHLVDAYTTLGQILVTANDTRGLQQLLEQLPPTAAEHPDIWFLRGELAQRQQSAEMAARCYWEAARIDPNRAEICYRLGQVLRNLNQSAAADRFLQRAQLLDRFSSTIAPLFEEGAHAERMNRAGQIAQDLGRLWEAWAWFHASCYYFPYNELARQQRDALAAQLDDATPQTLASCNPAREIDLAHYPLPTDSARVVHAAHAGPTPSLRPVSFVDAAATAGLDFEFVSGDNPAVAGMRIYHEFAGGVGVLDFDCDGWPDVYFSQGSQTPPMVAQTQYSDRMFRNLGEGRFADVTDQACLGDTEFSQGVAVGDFNQDGFADLFVANFGRNALYQNQGDGTFLDVTSRTGLQGEEWTTSCLIADLNADTLPDIYLANYVSGPEVLTKECGSRGLPRACRPDIFSPALDQLYVNCGDGTFRDVSGTARPADDGRSLGVVAADFEGSGQLSLFVANDMTPNHYLTHVQLQPDGTPVFEERGLIAGLAVDEFGRSQASMGIALGDPDQNGLLDFLVTNYYGEANAFYHQQAPGLFLDSITIADMRMASLEVLGFGAQFLDADLDGWPDLLVANGHVDDYTHEGTPYQMQPQFFRNTGNLNFVLEPAEQLGEYFAGRWLGRATALVDWNRDGRQDCIVMHLERPVALLTNRTANAGHHLCLQLRGVASNRDAIGARVELRIGPRTLYGQCAADGGFQASNQRQLVFGLDDATHIDELIVQWPSGQRQQFRDVPCDRELVIVENRSALFCLPAAK